MTAFETIDEAQSFMRETVDKPVCERHEAISEAATLRAFPVDLGGGLFTNVYEASFRDGAVAPTVHTHDALTSVREFAKRGEHPIVTGGGFFYLADTGSAAPRQLALNLSASNYQLRSLPVVDREAVVCDGRQLYTQEIQSLGVMSMNGYELSWSGSLTAHDTDVKVFGNGNAVIAHRYNEATGSIRALDEDSRFTPPIEQDDVIDVGFVARDDGLFVSKDRRKGGVDIFAHDIVLRCHERYLVGDHAMKVLTVGNLAIDGKLQGALSVGPMLAPQNFDAHPVNQDRSLGDKPPFLERPLARTVLYGTSDGMTHIRLLDGRPGSETFPGVTPSQVVQLVTADNDIAWGCFLDPGQTAKLCVANGGEVESFGNRHYLKWATKPGEKYVWVPESGRPTGSAIALQ